MAHSPTPLATIKTHPSETPAKGSSASAFNGTIEGFFGRSWSWQARHTHLNFLAQQGLHFYIYAPKSDTHLRRHWQTPWPDEQWQELQALRHHAKTLGVQFGIGLTPLDIYREAPAQQLQQLRTRLTQINQLQPDILCLLFDDMRGDLPQLAQQQIRLVQSAAQQSQAERIIFCPTYYSFDPVLEKVFGAMPANYWQDLGRGLDKHIDIFWTGEKVCSAEYSPAHLAQITQLLERPVFLWDNYPVNDGAVKSQHLHLRPFAASHQQLQGKLRGHAINPMNQAALSQLAIASLPHAYQARAPYKPQQLLNELAAQLLGPMAEPLLRDIPLLQDTGLKHMSDSDKRRLLNTYQTLQHNPACATYAAEIVQWLKGEYTFDPNCLTE